MKSAKGLHQDEEEDEYEEFGSKRDAQPSNTNRGIYMCVCVRAYEEYFF